METSRLNAYLSALPDYAWNGETACAAWDVTTVVAHLAGASHAFADRMRLGIAGDTSHQPGLPEPGSVNGETWAETNAERWTDIRQGMGDHRAVLAQFQKTGAELQSLLADLEETQWDCLCYHPGGNISVRTMVGFRLLEVVLHTWDIRVKREPSAVLSLESLPHLLDFIEESIGWFFTPSDPLSEPIRLRFCLRRLDDDMSRTFDLLINGGIATAVPVNDIPHAQIHGTLESFVLAICGRFPWKTAFDCGNFLCEANGVGDLLSSYFKGA